MAVSAGMIAKAAATVLSNEKLRKGVGWTLVAILSPIIVLIALLCSIGSGGADHNNHAVAASFYGVSYSTEVPAEFRHHIEEMRTAFSLLDSAVASVNGQTESGNGLDPIRIKAVFYALCFGEDKEMDTERKNLGWGNDLARPYTCSASDQEVQKQLSNLDVLIAGSFPERQTKEYGKKAKLFFRYSERILKTGNPLLKYPKRFFHWHACNPPWRKAYMLCASAYTAGDYAKFGLFRGRCYKWGYFPETIRYPSIDDLIDRKAKATILWCGRFLGWKHPDDVIEVARRLHDAGCCFKIEMIGTGEMEQQLKRQASEAGLLETNIRFLGAMSPEAVRRHMESAGICLFTSDRQEGWGAVLNEAMNSGCAVVASDAAGATPYLVNDGVNGSVYHSGNIQELYEKVRRLLENTTMQHSFGKAAYQTITELWNAEVAAKRFLQLSQALLNGTDASGLFANGPCSPAKPLREDWYQR